jgi:hypothetical protein
MIYFGIARLFFIPGSRESGSPLKVAFQITLKKYLN